MKQIAIVVLMLGLVGCSKQTIYGTSATFHGSLATDCRATTNDHAKPCRHKQTKEK